jgi:hypothetical protein
MKLLNQKHKIEKFTLMFVIGLALQTCIFSDIKNVEDLKNVKSILIQYPLRIIKQVDCLALLPS